MDTEALRALMASRRDTRHFLPEPVPEAQIWRLLEAAHLAPSVGHMQPWDFVVVDDPTLKAAMYAHVRQVNDEAGRRREGEEGKAYRDLKLQGILEAPTSLVVTCDTQRGGPLVLGRDTNPGTAWDSCCLAIQNLWLAAEAEGLGVGWVSLYEGGTLSALLGLPPTTHPVAWLCLGRPASKAPEPLLARVGWRPKLKLGDLVHRNRWGQPWAPAEAPAPKAPAWPPVVARPKAQVAPGDWLAQRLEDLPTPQGALGELGELALRLARIQGRRFPRVDQAWVVVMAGDHGVAEAGVSAYLPDTTGRMVRRFLAGQGVVNCLSRQAQAGLMVVDLGVRADFGEATALVHAKQAWGTADFRHEAAMGREGLSGALATGAKLVEGLGEVELLALGDMGIGNSTVAAALVAAWLRMDPMRLVGGGSWVGPEGRARKQAAVAAALGRHLPEAAEDPTECLRRLGGFEFAGLVGAMEAAAKRRIPVLLDGLVPCAAAMLAVARTPEVASVLVAATRSPEPAQQAVLRHLGLKPLLDLGLRLGEGSAAALALPLLRAACQVVAEVPTHLEANQEEGLAPGGRR